jgi:tetratricopeptide (TPR) repeat protein
LLKIDQILFKDENLSIHNKAHLLKFKGDVFNYNKNLDKAIDSYNDSYQLFKELKNSAMQIELLSAISDLQVSKENYGLVVDIQNELASILSKLESNKDLSAEYLKTFSKLYFKVGDMNKAFHYLRQAIENVQTEGNQDKLHRYYNDLAVLFLSNKNLDSSLYYSDLVEKYCLNTNNYQLCTEALLVKGSVYEQKEEFIKAEKKYKRVIKIQESIGVNSYQAYVKLGNFYKRMHLYKYAKSAFSTALNKIASTNNKNEILNLYHDIIENSLKDGDAQTAQKYLVKFDALNDEIKESERQKYNDFINEKFEIQKRQIEFLKEKHNLQKKQDELVLQEQIYKKNKILFIVLLALLGLFLILSMLYFRYRRLSNEKANIRLKNKVLGLQMNPHFIFNSLTAIQNSVMKNDILKSAELIAVFSKLIRQNLDFSAKEKIKLSDEIEMLKNYLTTQQFRFDNNFDYKINIDQTIDLDSIEIPPMLIQPFVENAIEHGIKNKTKGGKIEINIFKKENSICFEITDNGIGFDFEKETNKTKEEIHALNIFTKRLKVRQKGEHKGFVVTKLYDKNKNVKGTKVSFCLKN